ncbi:MAG: CheR family methyltransferase [Oligoflexia bacterium]|nr:CheR family methyltransferase [Oligoflexia bacterium]
MSNQVKSLSVHSDLIQQISLVVMEITGVQLKDRQRSMVEARLTKRMLELGLKTDEEYLHYFNSHREAEVAALVSLLTTHHTYFFREFAHFEYLERTGLRVAVEAAKARGERIIRIWSAACSRGQEVYSLAMFLNQHLKRLAPDFSYEILGTDVDPESVAIAKNGVFQYRDIKEVPLQFVSGNWARGTGEIADYVKAKGSIKDACRFEVLNLLKFDGVVGKKFDIIFCRNVFIYFTSEQIRKITGNFLKALTPEGMLFIGISESLNGLDLPLSLHGPSIYRREAKPEKAPAAAAPAAPLRVLCVDDSPSVLALLKQILKKEHGFEVVATAVNGLDAAKKLQEVKADVMTLDIHMPEQTGLEYLRKNKGPNHPPVVIISSVAREDAELALQCLQAGADDYVEKPALANMKERGDEIRTKLQCAYRTKLARATGELKLEKSFASPAAISKPEGCLRIIVASLADRQKLRQFFGELRGTQPPTFVFMEGCETAMPALVKEAAANWKGKVGFIETTLTAIEVGGIYLADFSRFYDQVARENTLKRTSILVYGQPSANASAKLPKWPGAQLLLEDIGKPAVVSPLHASATDVLPATSFAYCSTHFLGELK